MVALKFSIKPELLSESAITSCRDATKRTAPNGTVLIIVISKIT